MPVSMTVRAMIKKGGRVNKVTSEGKKIPGKCPHCNAETLSEAIVDDKFQHGVGETIHELTASVPVIGCDTCEECWTDYRAENIRERVIRELFGEIPPQQVKLDDGHYLEVLHTAHVLTSVFDDHILTHPAVMQDQDFTEKANKAFDALWDFYQVCGVKRHEFGEKESEQDKGNKG
jgi:hypothetical protein